MLLSSLCGPKACAMVHTTRYILSHYNEYVDRTTIVIVSGVVLDSFRKRGYVSIPASFERCPASTA